MSIVDNKKAFHDYHVEDRYEAGIVLEGWEVKAIRAGRAQLKEAYVIVRGDEIFLFGCHITPLPNINGFTVGEPTRTRKLTCCSAKPGAWATAQVTAKSPATTTTWSIW